ncbi:MAG: hypothetical protein CMG62_11485 [Candidatus Marinimicrobia bacterium]|nr:hypothetical protein [Candidatus Neomarinimicrobiota bacterium]
MKKMDNIEKIIWDISFENKISPPPNLDKAWNNVEKNLDEIENPSNHPQSNFFQLSLPNFFEWKFSLSSIVSFVLVLIISSPIAFKFINTKTLKANKGCLETFLLEDGSTVSLNSESKISFDASFNKDNRKINLIGEAFFEVSSGETPFIVKTDYGNVKVLGTSFNVRARADGFEVGVVKGNVVVDNKSKSVELKAGQQTDLKLSRPKKLNYQNYPGWKYETLVCDKMPLLKVSGEIERLFDISIKISNRLIEQTTISGVLQTTNLQTVLSSISLLAQCKFKFDGETCTFF